MREGAERYEVNQLERRMMVLVVLSNKESDVSNTIFCQWGFVEDQTSNRGSS